MRGLNELSCRVFVGAIVEGWWRGLGSQSISAILDGLAGDPPASGHGRCSRAHLARAHRRQVVDSILNTLASQIGAFYPRWHTAFLIRCRLGACANPPDTKRQRSSGDGRCHDVPLADLLVFSRQDDGARVSSRRRAEESFHHQRTILLLPHGRFFSGPERSATETWLRFGRWRSITRTLGLRLARPPGLVGII